MSLRVRSYSDLRNDFVNWNVYHRPQWGGDYLYSTQRRMQSFSRYESFTDFTNKKIAGSGIYPASSADHIQLACVTKDCNDPFRWTNWPMENSESYARPEHVPFSISPKQVLDIFPQPLIPPIVYANLNLDAWKTFREQVPVEVSIINFIWELKDLESLIPKFSGKNLPKTANDSFLNYSFGWKPFIGDLQKLVNIYKSITQRLDYLRKTRGKITSVKFRKFNVYKDIRAGTGDDILTYEQDNPFNSWSYKMRYHLKLKSRTIDYFASCKLLHELDGLDDAWSGFKAAVAGLGINNPASIVWEAIPFSFVLDWFLPVGNFLSNFSVQPFSGRWEISNMVNTLHDRAILECYYTNDLPPEGAFVNFGGGSPTWADRYKGFISYDRYTRRKGLPLTMDDVGFLDLTDSQQKLFLSLLAGTTVLK